MREKLSKDRSGGREGWLQATGNAKWKCDGNKGQEGLPRWGGKKALADPFSKRGGGRIWSTHMLAGVRKKEGKKSVEHSVRLAAKK